MLYLFSLKMNEKGIEMLKNTIRKNTTGTFRKKLIIGILAVAVAAAFCMPVQTMAQTEAQTAAPSGQSEDTVKDNAAEQTEDPTAAEQQDVTTEQDGALESADDTAQSKAAKPTVTVKKNKTKKSKTKRKAGKVVRKSVKTKVKGLKAKKQLKYISKNPTVKIKVTHGMGREVKLQKWQNGKWVTKKTYHAAKGDKTKTIRITYPAEWKNKKQTKWRIKVPALKVTKKKPAQRSSSQDMTAMGGGNAELTTASDTEIKVYEGVTKKTTTTVETLKWPLKGHRKISSRWGGRICPFHGYEFHPAVDIPARTGTKVYAAASGKVLYAGWSSGFGKRVKILHSNGKRVTTSYNHLSRIKVKKGQIVKQGQVIGRVGSTGNSTGSHLDFRVYISKKSKNPMKVVER